MATRAERFRAMEQRSGAASKPRRKRPTKAGSKVENAAAEVSGTLHTTLSSALRNLSRGRRATSALEDTIGATRPSRKSGRRSKNRTKPATPLQTAQSLKRTSPRARHEAKA